MQQTRKTFVGIFFGTLLIMLGVVVALVLAQAREGEQVSAEVASVNTLVAKHHTTLTAVAEITPLATATSKAPPTATPNPLELAAIQATATAELLPSRVQFYRNLPVRFQETFDSNEMDWPENEGNDALSLGDRALRDGVYTWELSALDDFIWVESPDSMPSAGDFYYSAELAQDRHAVGFQYTVFRYQDNLNFYYFGLCNNRQEFKFGVRVEGGWRNLLRCGFSDTINVDGANKLDVIAQGSQFILLINDEIVGEVWDGSFAEGRLGIMIEMRPDDINRFTFDNLELRSP